MVGKFLLESRVLFLGALYIIDLVVCCSPHRLSHIWSEMRETAASCHAGPHKPCVTRAVAWMACFLHMSCEQMFFLTHIFVVYVAPLKCPQVIFSGAKFSRVVKSGGPVVIAPDTVQE